MVTAEQLEQKYIELKEELASLSPDILRRFPMSDYPKDLESSRRREILLCFRRGRSQKHVFEEAVSQYGDQAVQLYFKLVLCCFMSDSLERLSQESLPGEIVDLCHKWFEAVLRELSTRPNHFYDYRSVELAQDMRTCSLTEMPVGGAWVVEARRVSLKPLVKGGIGQSLTFLAFMTFKCGGYAPYYMFHAARRYLRHFNEKQMNLAYLRMAEMMTLNRDIKGLHTRGWLLDPQLEEISPDLAYLRQVPQQNGAKLFAGGVEDSDVKNALRLSPKRQQLHKQGKYAPTTYALIWPREEFLSWAEKTNASPEHVISKDTTRRGGQKVAS